MLWLSSFQSVRWESGELWVSCLHPGFQSELPTSSVSWGHHPGASPLGSSSRSLRPELFLSCPFSPFVSLPPLQGVICRLENSLTVHGLMSCSEPKDWCDVFENIPIIPWEIPLLMCRQYPSCILPLSITGLLSASLGFLCERNLSLSSFFSVTNRTTKSNLRKEGVYFILNSQIIIPHCQESGQEHRQKPEPETLGGCCCLTHA